MKVMFHQRKNKIDISGLRAQFPDIAFAEIFGPKEAAAQIANADVLVVSTSVYTPELAKVINSGARQLKWIHFTTSGIDSAVKLGFPSGVTVTNSAGLRANNLSDHAFGLLLFLARRFRDIEAARLRREWVREEMTPLIRGLEGMTMVILGMGAFGQSAARKAKAFDMKTIGISRAYKPDQLVDKVYPRARAKEAIVQADVLLICVPAERETLGLINTEMLSAMKKGSWLINVSRGDIVVEPDLIAACKNGPLAGAGLDVTVEEPLPETSGLWSLDNVIITPHVGGQGSHSDAPMLKIFADNLALYLQKKPLEKVLDWPSMVV